MSMSPEAFPPYKDTLIGHLGIEFREQSRDRVVARLPIDHRTIQPTGVAHGGALIALAETLASLGTLYNIDPDTQFCVGQEINASLLRPVPAGSYVEGVASVLHQGRTTMVWEVKIHTPEGKLAAVCRCTIAIRPRT
jgi:1,4-dihydroxy-2-naphthoyl-CoA hydrolase